MKKMILAILFVLTTISISAETIEVLAFSYPPFMGETVLGKDGLMIEMVRAAFAEEDVDVKVTYLPTKRAMFLVSNDEALAYIGILKIFSEEDQRKLEELSIFKLRFLAFYLKKKFPNGFTFNSYEDLKSYNIGVLPGLTEAVGKANGLKVETANNLEVVFKKIGAGRNDLGLAVDLSIEVLLRELFGNRRDEFAIYQDKPFVTAESTLLLNTKHSDYSKFAPKFKKGLKKIYENGKWQMIMEKYYGKGNVPKISVDLIKETVEGL